MLCHCNNNVYSKILVCLNLFEKKTTLMTKTQILNKRGMSNSAQKKHKNVVLVKMATTAQLMLHSISHSEQNLTF